MVKFIFLISSLFTTVSYAQYSNDIKIQTLLKSDTNVIGQKIKFPRGHRNEFTILKIVIPKGGTTGWHKHPFPVFAVMLKGILTVEIKGEEPFEIKAGSATSEVVNLLHRGVNSGTEDVEILAFYTGEKGTPLVIRK